MPSIRKTNKEFLQEVYEQVGNEYTFLEEYKGALKQIKVKHNCAKCNNYEWLIAPNKFLNSKNKCPKCSGNIKKTTEEYRKEIYNLVGNEFTVLTEYKGYNKKFLMRHNCKKCNNYEWLTSPIIFKEYTYCPYCKNHFHKIKFSKKELISNLKKKKIELNRTPREKDMNNPNYFIYAKIFGSWNNALKKAGFNNNGIKKYTNEEIINLYIELCVKLNKIANINDIKKYYKRNEMYSYGLIYIRFGSFIKFKNQIKNRLDNL
jgi:Zn finger protein HypA/HybF involved in hydrogenase expression